MGRPLKWTVEQKLPLVLSIRSVWFVENNEDTPRFVTAYPLEGAGND